MALKGFYKDANETGNQGLYASSCYSYLECELEELRQYFKTVLDIRNSPQIRSPRLLVSKVGKIEAIPFYSVYCIRELPEVRSKDENHPPPHSLVEFHH